VYAYATEDLAAWEVILERTLKPGQFGENLSTRGVDVTGALIGETWRIGTALLQISGPRIPCVVFQNWVAEPQWVKRFVAVAKPGAYLRVLEEGELGVDDEIVIQRRPAHDVTIGLAFRALTTDRRAGAVKPERRFRAGRHRHLGARKPQRSASRRPLKTRPASSSAACIRRRSASRSSPSVPSRASGTLSARQASASTPS
jgi:MOSC domain-containing protein YiiM